MTNASPTQELPHPTLIQSHWQGWLSLVLRAMATGLAISVALLLVVALTAATAMAQAISQPEPRRALPESLDGLPRGASIPDGAALLFDTDHGPIAAPLQYTDVTMRVSGHVVRTKVNQTYRNPSKHWLNATYRFPMPDGSAVDGLIMRAGDLVIRGEIKAKEVARKTYERAKKQGKRASLISQSKPNDFTARVANISPDGDISIEIEYQQVLRLGPDGWALRFPTVVAPRYLGNKKTELALIPVSQRGDDELHNVHVLRTHLNSNEDRLDSTGSGYKLTAGDDQDAPMTPIMPIVDERQNRIKISIELNAGIPVSVPRSLTHQVTVDAIDETSGSYKIGLQVPDIANRDFELQWEPQAGQQPTGSVQFEQFDGHYYGLAVVSPPDPQTAAPLTQPREVIFVVDTSGSMHGDSLTQATESLHFGLRRLNPKDRFNVIRFSSDNTALFNASQIASPQNVANARNFLDRLEAQGGTEIAGALERALRPSIPAGFISQVIFITDGAVGAEQSLFNMIDSLIGNRRLFTVGIGSAPNDYFMGKAAAAGRGSFTMIGSTRQVKQRMTRLFEQLAFPMLTDLKLRTVHGEIIATDAPIRDLYAGEPVVHSFRVKEKPTGLLLEGTRDRQAWQEEIKVIDTTNTGIHRLWARDTLDGFSAQIRRADLSSTQRDDLRSGATRLALKHGLVSRYTSLVAVDHTPARSSSESSRDASVPRQLPKGWSAKHTLNSGGGQLAQGSLGLWLQLLMGGGLLLLSVAFGALFLTRAENLIDRAQS